MGRYGLGFGALASARGTRGGSPADSASLIGPAVSWTGIAGSGFGGTPPIDPVRVTAKPALRLITPPKQAFTNRLVVGVIGGANDDGTLIDNLGIEKVTVHFEGNSIDIGAPTLRSFADANGETVRYFGWWADLEKPAGTSGTAQVYFEATPRDATMQNRVIGPFTYFPVAQLHDFQVEVARTAPEVAGSSYRTIQGALGYFRAQNAKRPKITVVESGDYDLEGSSFPYQFEGWCELVASVPITITRPSPDAGGSFRPRRGPIRFRGKNITIDFIRSSELHTEPGHEPFWCDGVNLTISAGRESLRFGENRGILTHLIRDFGWMTECNVTNLWSAGARCKLVRGCTFSRTWGDLFTGSQAVIDCVVDDHDSGYYRQFRDALQVSYAGAGTATLAMSGANGLNGRVITAQVNGATVGSFTVATGGAAFEANTNFTMQNVADWLNALPGWSALVMDNDWPAAVLQAPATIGAWGPIAISAAAKTFMAFSDVHADMFQTSGENICIAGNLGTGINAQVFFFTGAPSRDFLVINNAFENDLPVGDLSQFSDAHSHVVFAHNVLATQNLLLRGSDYNADSYCLIANNALSAISNGGVFDPDLTIAFNHLNSAAAVPQGAIGTSVGGSVLGNFADAAGGDFTPQGALLAYPKPPTIRYDAKHNARRSPVAPVGAVRAPVGSDVTAPIITSADPSGSYVEGGMVGGQLSANEQANWLVSGQDASAVTLNPDTGAWSVGPTDHAVQANYAFTFEAIDAQGNAASQPVALSITPASATRPILTSFADEADGANGATLSVETNLPDGLLYWAITSDGGVPDVNAIKAGSGFAASGTQPVSAMGLQTIAVTGLAAAATYMAYLIHTSGSGEDSAVASSDGFTTLAVSSGGAIILIVAGQSNARKASTAPANVPARYTSLANASIWDVTTAAPVAYVAGAVPGSGSEGRDSRWGTEAEAIYQMRQAGETRPIYVVHRAVNGQSLDISGAGNWSPAQAGQNFASLETQVANLRNWLDANTAHTTFDEYVFWNQGEADANDDTRSANYAANWTAFLAAFRSRISASAFFIAERIRPLGYADATTVDDTAGFTYAYRVREATLAGILADGNGTVIDTDFDVTNFTDIHPVEPTTWNINSWTSQIGLRAYAAIAGTYTGTYGSITDAVPAAFTIPASSGVAGSVISSNSVPVLGIERRAAVTMTAGLEMRITNRNGSVHTDWTETPGFIDKFQSFAVRETAPADGVTITPQVTIGGVSTNWSLTGTAATSYRTDTQAWLDALATAGGASLSPTQAGGLDDYYAALDTASILPKVKAQVLSLGSEIASTIRIDNPAILALNNGVTAYPWASGGYLATANNQIVNLQASPSTLTELNSISITAILTVLGTDTDYLLGSAETTPTVGLSFRTTTVRFRAHSAHVTFTVAALSKLGPYTATSDGTTAKLYDPDGIEIGSVAITPNASKTAAVFRIGGSGTDSVNRIWGASLNNHLTAGDVATLHSELQTLRALF